MQINIKSCFKALPYDIAGFDSTLNLYYLQANCPEDIKELRKALKRFNVIEANFKSSRRFYFPMNYRFVMFNG